MKKTLFIAFVLVIVTLACGRKTMYPTPVPYAPMQAPVATPIAFAVPTPKPAPNYWTESEMQSEVYGCVQTASFQQQLTQDELRKTTAACRCVFETASQKWSYTTYRAYPKYYLGELERSGVVQQCSARL